MSVYDAQRSLAFMYKPCPRVCTETRVRGREGVILVMSACSVPHRVYVDVIASSSRLKRPPVDLTTHKMVLAGKTPPPTPLIRKG